MISDMVWLFGAIAIAGGWLAVGAIGVFLRTRGRR